MRGVLNSCLVLTPTASQVAEYAEYLRDVRGLASSSINEQVRIAEQFLAHLHFNNAPKRLATICSRDIEVFVQKIGKSLSRATLRDRVTLVRNFLRFLAAKGKVSPDLADQIDRPRVYRLEKLPRTLQWKTVQALLRSIPKTTVKGRRDYTMLFLMASYGLRSCEVVALTLDDVDWRAGLIRIRQSKTRNVLNLPLIDEVARVLIEYLRQVSRPAGYRNLFFQVRAPIKPLRREALRDAFDKWSKRSGLDIPYHGPHCIRHSYAVHFLSQETSLKTIGDLLGHRRPESTASYLRLATDQLREAKDCFSRWQTSRSRTVGCHGFMIFVTALPLTRCFDGIDLALKCSRNCLSCLPTWVTSASHPPTTICTLSNRSPPSPAPDLPVITELLVSLLAKRKGGSR